MWDVIVAALGTVEFWQFASIPLISALVGWGTNVLAIKMTFYPLNFWGIKPLGWQGIIPSKAGEMAGKAVDLLTEKLITIEERFDQIEPERVAEEMEPTLNRMAVQLTNEIMEEEAPLFWESAPKLLKARVFQRMSEGMPEVIEDLMQDIKNNISDLFDLRGMVVESLENDRELLNQIFLRVGMEEFRFIERSGFYFGFFFGVIQMLIFALIEKTFGLGRESAAWSLPVAGLFVGWATNALALKMIFFPLRARKIGPFTIQGLFIKRQMDVAEEYAQIVSSQILTSKAIFEKMLTGPSADQLLHIIQIHIKEAVDSVAGVSKAFFQVTQGTRRYISIKRRLAARFVDELPRSIKYTFDYAEEALDIHNTLANRMKALSPVEFISFLRPVFQEDEWKLILLGAILGFMAGLLQLVVIFGQGFF
ncbi:MAG: hypothetical protein AAFP89_21875 [Bacteroidota bacterium]